MSSDDNNRTIIISSDDANQCKLVFFIVLFFPSNEVYILDMHLSLKKHHHATVGPPPSYSSALSSSPNVDTLAQISTGTANSSHQCKCYFIPYMQVLTLISRFSWGCLP